MANWATHLMIADRALAAFPALHRRGFCVGNIAPDCNVENEDWTAFTPPREVTHWMQGAVKNQAAVEAFSAVYLSDIPPVCDERYGFLLGYGAHLLVDAAFQAFIRDEARVRAVWQRLRPTLPPGTALPETWDTVKRLLPKAVRNREMAAIEAPYLAAHPDSGYWTEILPLTEFPDYLDYLPTGAIVRKIGVMGAPPRETAVETFLGITPAEYAAFVDMTAVQLCDWLQPKMP